MKVQPAIVITPVRRDLTPVLGPFIADKSHTISIGFESAIGARPHFPNGTTLLPGGSPGLTALSPASVSDTQRVKLDKAFFTLGGSLVPQLKRAFPEASGPIDGIEFVLASKAAFDAWSDPGGKTIVKPLIKSARAMAELLDIVKTVVPALGQVPYLDAAGTVIKAGDAVWQFRLDWAEATAPARR